MSTGSKTVPAANSADLAKTIEALLGGGAGQKTSTTQNTSALQDVLAQLNGIDPSAQLATLFQQAQAKIPQIAAAKAGSGSRTPGGTLDPQMAKLLSQITLAAQQQMSQQQLQKAEIATRAAQGVANGSTQVTQTPQASSMQKLMQAITVAQGAGKMFGVDLGQEGGKKLRELFGITSTGLGESVSPIGLSSGLDFGSGSQPFTGLSGADLSIPSPSMSFGNDFSGFSDFSSFGSMPDFSSSFSFGDMSSAPALSFGDVSFGSGGGGFGSGLDFGSFPSGTEGAGASFSTGLSSGSPSIMPLFSAANYLANPSKIGDAFELGEGNVLGDISQLASLGSTIGGVGSLFGVGMGGLTGLAPILGPLGIVLGGIASALDAETSDTKAAKELDALLFTGKDYKASQENGMSDAAFAQFQKVAGGNSNLSAEQFNAALETARSQSSSEYLQQQYKQYGITMGRDLEAADLFVKWNSRLDPYKEYLTTPSNSYLNALLDQSAGGSFSGKYSDLLGVNASEADRQYAAERDNPSPPNFGFSTNF